MSKELIGGIAAAAGVSTAVTTIIVQFFGVDLGLLLWTAVGSFAAVALAKEITRRQAVTRFVLGFAIGSPTTQAAITGLGYAGSPWAHKLFAVLCGALALLLVQLLIEHLPRLFERAVEIISRKFGG